MKVRCATEKDYPDIRNFYYSLTDTMVNAEFTPGWEKDIYPTQEFLITSIKNHELYLVENETEIQASMIVNHSYNDGYKEVRWSVDAEDIELLVIHALGVHPNYAGQGIAKQLVAAAIGMAEQQNIKTIRLDVLEGNIPAEKVYSKMGFQYVTTLKMFYEDTGWTNYKVYEYIV